MRYAALILTFATVCLLCGCSTFSPRYDLPPRAQTLEQASSQVNTAISDLEGSISERNQIDGWTGLGALLGAAGAALSPVFKGSRDLTVGLAAFAGGNYAVSSIYGNRTVTNVLASGVEALTCVENAAGGALDAHRTIVQLRAVVTKARHALNAGTKHIYKNLNPTQKLQVAEVKALAAGALEKSKIRFAQETNLAGQISGAVQRILTAVNAQVQSLLPDPSAIERAGSGIAASSLASIAAGPSPITAAKPRSPTGGGKPGAAPPVPNPMVTLLVDNLDGARKALEAALASPVPALSSDTCKVAEAPAVAPMTTDAPASIVVKHGDPPLNYKISGGDGIYTPQWIGTEPPDVMAAMHGDTLMIFVRPGITVAAFSAGQTYKLDVYDSTPGMPKHLPNPIVVNTK